MSNDDENDIYDFYGNVKKPLPIPDVLKEERRLAGKCLKCGELMEISHCALICPKRCNYD